MSFKFQSDSINTEIVIQGVHCRTDFKFQSDSINTPAFTVPNPYANYFKFQSDSINTKIGVKNFGYLYIL